MPANAVRQAYLHGQKPGNQDLFGEHGAVNPLHVDAVLDQEPLEVIDRVVQQVQELVRLQPRFELDHQVGIDQIDLVLVADLEQHHPGIRIDRVQDRKSTRLNSSHLGISYA